MQRGTVNEVDVKIVALEQKFACGNATVAQILALEIYIVDGVKIW